MALLATAEHVLPAAAESNPDAISLDWLKPPGQCRSMLQPVTLWRPEAPVGVRNDIAFIAASVRCSRPLAPVPNAWADGTPSFGLTVHFVAGSPPDLSDPITLSSSCVRTLSCFDEGAVHLQDSIPGGVSGSAVFSADGLAGIAATATDLVAAPQMLDWLVVCAAGGCRRSGEESDLEPFLDAMENPPPDQ
jgi:hypothetical protein